MYSPQGCCRDKGDNVYKTLGTEGKMMSLCSQWPPCSLWGQTPTPVTDLLTLDFIALLLWKGIKKNK